MTNGSLMRDIPRLEPDDEFVDRLAELAAASKPTRGGVVVPVAFQGPAARSIATAAAVAAIAAGAAVAASQLGHPHHEPGPPISSVATSNAPDNHGSRHTARDTNSPRQHQEQAEPQGHDSTGPVSSSTTTQGGAPAADDHGGSPGSDDSPAEHHGGSPGADPSGHDNGDDHGGGPGGGSDPGSNGGSDGPKGGSHDGSGGNDGSGKNSDSGRDGSGD